MFHGDVVPVQRIYRQSGEVSYHGDIVRVVPAWADLIEMPRKPLMPGSSLRTALDESFLNDELVEDVPFAMGV